MSSQNLQGMHRSTGLRRALAGLVLSLGLTLSSRAHAQQAAGAWHWYGWQTLTTDGAGASLLVVSGVESAHSSRAATALVYAGAATLVLGAPVVHAIHRRWGAAVGSLALRVGLPALGLLSLDQPCEGECGGAYLLGLFAFTAPVAFDAAALSWERRPTPATLTAPRLRIQPYANARRKQFNAGFVVTF